MGFVRKRRSKNRGTRFVAVAHVGGRDLTLATYDTFAEATDAWQHAEVQERRRTGGSSLLAGRMPFRDLVALYMQAAQLEPSTRSAYASHCRAHLLPRFGDRPIADLSSAEVGRWMNDQLAAQLSVRTRVATRITLSSILQFAVNNGQLSFNPVRGTRAPRTTALRRRRAVLKPEQWPALRREFNEYGPETQLLIDVAIDTGLRFGELTDLRPSHLDQHRKPFLRVQTVATWPGEEFSNNGDVVERKQYTKGAEDRNVDLSPQVAATLTSHLTRHCLGPDELIFNFDRLREEHARWRAQRAAEQRTVFEAEWQAKLAAEPISTERFVVVRGDGRVRSGEHGSPNTYALGCRCAHCTYINTAYARQRREVRRGGEAPVRRGPPPKGRPGIREPWLNPQWFGEVVWRPATARAGLQWVHFHDLRHAHATWLLAAGVPVRSVQRRLGHRNLATTEIYLGELVEVEDIASFLGRYHEIFSAPVRGEIWGADEQAEREAQAGGIGAAAPDAQHLGEMLNALPPDQLAALLTQALTRGRGPSG
ncbi:MAG: site-specific integrase [Actinomycetota bacterium]|nr:site-specific integrase [Actinomycetota bacterium]